MAHAHGAWVYETRDGRPSVRVRATGGRQVLGPGVFLDMSRASGSRPTPGGIDASLRVPCWAVMMLGPWAFQCRRPAAMPSGSTGCAGLRCGTGSQRCAGRTTARTGRQIGPAGGGQSPAGGQCEHVHECSSNASFRAAQCHATTTRGRQCRGRPEAEGPVDVTGCAARLSVAPCRRDWVGGSGVTRWSSGHHN